MMNTINPGNNDPYALNQGITGAQGTASGYINPNQMQNSDINSKLFSAPGAINSLYPTSDYNQSLNQGQQTNNYSQVVPPPVGVSTPITPVPGI
jgi:hypothetical protein